MKQIRDCFLKCEPQESDPCSAFVIDTEGTQIMKHLGKILRNQMEAIPSQYKQTFPSGYNKWIEDNWNQDVDAIRRPRCDPKDDLFIYRTFISL